MSTTIRFHLPGRRYHATPWGHHVNEGLVEWPPSPWRILRGLLATGFNKANWTPDAPPSVARELIQKLSETLPHYWLPPVSLGHSRHYVDAGGKKPLIIDTWARLEQDSFIEAHWPDLVLPPRELAVLGQLVPLIGYLGRAESWVEAELVEAPSQPSNCWPVFEDSPGDEFEAVRVLCAQKPGTYLAWVESIVEALSNSEVTAKKTKGTLRKGSPPVDLLAALCVETGWLQQQGWSAAPGSRQVLYWRRRDALEFKPVEAHKVHPGKAFTMALFALATSSRRTTALPQSVRVFPQGRLFHKALARTINGLGDSKLALAMLGCDGEEYARGHNHAHLVHLDLDEDGRLDHVLLWIPSGVEERVSHNLAQVRKTWMKGGASELQVALCGVGTSETLRPAGDTLGKTLSKVLGPVQGCRTWISSTPFVCPRFTKTKGKDSVQGQVLAELRRRELPEAEVTVSQNAAFRHFVLHDGEHGHRPPVAIGYRVRLAFAERVIGPICLGYGSHYGLGLFQAESQEKA